MVQDSLGRNLRVLRAERGITLGEAEELTGVTQETISALEHNQRGAYTSTLRKLADAYGVTLGDLMGEASPVGVGKAEAPKTGRPGGADAWAEWTAAALQAYTSGASPDDAGTPGGGGGKDPVIAFFHYDEGEWDLESAMSEAVGNALFAREHGDLPEGARVQITDDGSRVEVAVLGAPIDDVVRRLQAVADDQRERERARERYERRI